jgi:hypothetical protein
MNHQLREGEEAKKRSQNSIEVGFEPWKLWTDACQESDIDPAEFFDPEEFGYQGGFHDHRP